MSIYTFIISSIIIILLPGTGVVYTVSTGLAKGKRAGVIAAFGCTAGIVPHLFVSVLLSSFILKYGNHIFSVIKVIGALYLIYLGIGMIISKTQLNFENEKTDDKEINIIRHGVLINILNPKLTLFFFSFLPQYVSESSCNYTLYCLLYGLLFMLITFVAFAAYGAFAGAMSKFAIRTPKVLDKIQKLFGIVFIIFAIKLALNS